MTNESSTLGAYLARVSDKTAVGGVVGLGYVGLPLAVELAQSGYRTVGFDINQGVVDGINAGRSHIQDVAGTDVAELVKGGLLRATTEPADLRECDLVSVCVPTPLNKIKDPDLSYVITAGKLVRDSLRPGQVIILESTTYPGTTREVLLPILEETGLKVGQDFFLCFSPERVDPGNPVWHTRNTPKVLGGITPACMEAGMAFYQQVFETMVPVESAEAAELVKVYENTFRMINIGLANELAQACDKLGLDVWGVIEAAATKPFGFMKFTPGPGLGGHCIPLDPHYLSWKMRTLAFKTRMIEVASEINAEMPGFVVRKVADALNDERKAVNGSKVLVLGVAYKRDVDDLRESPSLVVIETLRQAGALVAYNDPFFPEVGHGRHYHLHMRSTPLEDLGRFDCVLILTDHSLYNYGEIVSQAKLVVDSRNATRSIDSPKIVRC